MPLAGLDAVPAEEKNYEKSGFVTAFHDLDFRLNSSAIAKLPSPLSAAAESVLVPFSQITCEALAAFTAPIDVCDRVAVYMRLASKPGNISIACVSHSSGALEGFVILRSAIPSGYLLGPLYATDSRTALALLRDACTRVPQDSVIMLSVPEINSEGVRFMREDVPSAQHVSMCARMYRGGKYEVDKPQHIYAIGSLDVG